MNRLHLILALTSLFAGAQAQEIPPELAQLKASHERAIVSIRVNSEARTKPITTSYLAALDRMLAQVANDPVLSVPVTQERERAALGKSPTAEDRGKFSPALQQLRANCAHLPKGSVEYIECIKEKVDYSTVSGPFGFSKPPCTRIEFRENIDRAIKECAI